MINKFFLLSLDFEMDDSNVLIIVETQEFYKTKKKTKQLTALLSKMTKCKCKAKLRNDVWEIDEDHDL